MKLYELNYLIPDDFPEEQSKSLVERLSALIQKNGGTVQEVKPALRQNLNKPIKGRSSVFMTTLNFTAAPEKMGEIKKNIALEPEILRSFVALRIIKVEGKAPRRLIRKPQIAPSPLAKQDDQQTKVELEKIDQKLKEILGE